MIARLLPRIAARLPERVIETEGDVYLRRYYVCGVPASEFWKNTRPRLGRLPFTVYLHRFERPDRERELHNHPFEWSYALILSGGYVEERRHPTHRDAIIERYFEPLQVNRINADDFHRVSELKTTPTWTLFIAGPKTKTWGFWRRETNEFIPHRAFLAWLDAQGQVDAVLHGQPRDEVGG